MELTGAPERPRISQTKIVFGLVVMGIGLLLLLDQMSWWGFRWNVPLWPWILILIGISKFSDRPPDDRGRLRGRRSAVWLMFIGAWGLLNEYRLFGIHYGDSWPILVIGAGAFMVWRSIDPPSCDRATAAPAPKREP
jgi:LiaF transmembrane domain